MVSVRVRLLHLSDHLNRGEFAEKAAIGDAEKSTSGDNQDLCVVAATKSIPVAEKGGDCLVCGEWYPKEFHGTADTLVAQEMHAPVARIASPRNARVGTRRNGTGEGEVDLGEVDLGGCWSGKSKGKGWQAQPGWESDQSWDWNNRW